jgi:putative peptidoglycan lipid II flippase
MSLARDTVTVGIGTLVSRLLAYVRDATIAALLGAGPFSQAFFAVLQVVNFFRRLLAEGALNSAFVPLWLRLAESEDGSANANRFTARIFVAIGCINGTIALFVVVFSYFIIVVIAPGFDETRRTLAAFYLLIVALYIVLAGLVAVLAAALNAQGRIGAVTASTVIFNVVLLLVLALAVAEHIEQFYVGVWLAAAIVVAGTVQLLITGTAWLSSGERFQRVRARARDETGTFFRRALPGLIAAGMPQLKLIAATIIVSSTPMAVSWLYYANRLYELPLGIASVAISAVMVPRMAASRRAGGREAYAAAQSRACEIALGLALPAAAAFALLAPQIAGGLFEHGAFGASDTAAVSTALIAICSGLPGHVLEKWLGAVSFAHEDTHTPMLAALCGLAAAIIGGELLFPRYGYVSVAAAIAMSGWVGAGLLGALLARRRWLQIDQDATRRLPRIAVGTVVMGLAVAGGVAAGQALFPALVASAAGRLALLAVLVTLGLTVYVAALQILGVATLKDIVAALRRPS